MPPSKAQGTPEEAALGKFLQDFQLAAQRTAQKLGRPLGTDHVSEARKVAMWSATDPKADHATILQQLQTSGLPPEQLDPQGPDALAVVKASPKLAPLYAEVQADPELANTLASFAVWPLRHALLRAIPDPGEQVREAERLQRAYERQHGGPTADAPDAPDAAAGAAVPSGPMPPSMTEGAAVPLPVSAGAPPVAPPPDATLIGG
jgi:hypothetical protein